MSKIEKKSITDLLGSKEKRRPTAAEIEAITQQIHQPNQPNTTTMYTVNAVPEAAPIALSKTTANAEELIKRISVNAPVRLYLKAKSKATLESKTLMAYILELMDADTKDM